VQVERLDEEAIPRLAERRICVLFVSTTGDGELPDHSKPWWRALLRRDLPKTALSQLKFAVFGLGDSSYIRFNAAARKIAARLPQLGAVPLCERGLGDEQSEPGGLDQDYDAWLKNQLFPVLNRLKDGDGGDDTIRELLSKPEKTGAQKRYLKRAGTLEAANSKQIPLPGKIRCRYAVSVVTDGGSGSAATHAAAEVPLPPIIAAPTAGLYKGDKSGAEVGPWPAKLSSNDRLTASGWRQDVRQLTLDYSETAGFIPFRPGDVAMVYPRNTGTAASEEAVSFFSEYLGMPLNTMLTMTTHREEHHHHHRSPHSATEDGADEEESDSPLLPYPTSHPISLKQLLECYLDIQGMPRRSFLEQAAVYCSDSEQAEKLLEMSGYLSSETGGDEESASYSAGLYRLYVLKESRTYHEVLRDFTSCKIPLEALLEMIPPLKPRHFSIASSSVTVAASSSSAVDADVPAVLSKRSSLDLCVGLVEYKTQLKRDKIGVCSGFLASLKPGETVWLQVRKGSWMPPWPLPIVPSTPASTGSMGSDNNEILQEERYQLASGLSAGSAVPMILVGPGTGVAPMRSIWQERHAAMVALSQMEEAAPPNPAPCWLFYGCRNATKDWLYASETAAAAITDGSLSHYDAAFSRPSEDSAHALPPPASTATSTTSSDSMTPQNADTAAASTEETVSVAAQASTTVAIGGVGTISSGAASSLLPATARRSDLMFWCASSSPSPSSSYELATPVRMRANAAVTYVQKRLASHSKEIKEILLDNPSSLVFISGSAKRMPSDVIGEIKEEVMMKEGGMSEEEAKKAVAMMETRRRLVVEAWS
jgi:sulfite reductase alpha subunit-like flavoprotein